MSFFSCLSGTLFGIVSQNIHSDEIIGSTIDEKAKFIEELIIERFGFSPQSSISYDDHYYNLHEICKLYVQGLL
jgi:hypothetical protein